MDIVALAVVLAAVEKLLCVLQLLVRDRCAEDVLREGRISPSRAVPIRAGSPLS